MKNSKNSPTLKNKITLFRWLYSGQLQLNSLWEKRSYRYKFIFRTVFLNPRTFNWLGHLANYPLMGYYLLQQTNLPCKLQRPYLSSCMSSKDRFQALVYHYNFLSSRCDKITHAFYGDKPYPLAELTVKNGETIKVVIQSKNKFSREGELSIYFYDENNISLAVLTFSIIEYNQKSTLFIAGLQGANTSNAKQIIQHATKSCYGLFPKRFVVESALIFAEFFQIEQIVAVGNNTHIYNNWRYKNRFKKLYSDYDNFWQMMAAQKNEQGLFMLPTKISRKPLEDIASKKRSEYRNRYQLLDNLACNIKHQLSKLQ